MKKQSYSVKTFLLFVYRYLILFIFAAGIGFLCGKIGEISTRKNYYSLECTISSTLNYENPNASKVISILTSNKGINYLNEQLKGNWECANNPAMDNNELFSSLSFVDKSPKQDKGPIVFSVSFKTRNKESVSSSITVIGNSSCSYLNTLFVTEDYSIIEMQQHDSMRITTVTNSKLCIIFSLLFLGISFCFGILFDIRENKIYFYGDLDLLVHNKNDISIEKQNIRNLKDEIVCFLSSAELEFLETYAPGKYKTRLIDSVSEETNLAIHCISGITRQNDIEKIINKGNIAKIVLLSNPKAPFSWFFPISLFLKGKCSKNNAKN